MMKRQFHIHPIVLLLIMLTAWTCKVQIVNKTTSISFINLRLIDSSRNFFENDSLNTGRPISVLVWMPSKNQTSIDSFSIIDYLTTSLSDEGKTLASKSEKIMKDLMYGYGFDSLALDSLYKKLMSKKSAVTLSKDKPSERYPILILSSALNTEAIYYTDLAEFLARNGFVVAALNSPSKSVSEPAGYDQEGIENQLRDLRYALGELKKLPYVDTTRIAAGSWSTGAIAAALLQLTSPEIKAFISIDGGTGYTYGWELLTQSPHYDSARQTIPAIHFHGTASPTRVEKNFNHIKSFGSKHTYLVELTRLNHYHFASVAQCFNALQLEPNIAYKNGYDDLKNGTLSFLSQYLRNRQADEDTKIEVMKSLETAYIHIENFNGLP